MTAATVNATMQKFGWPGTKVAELDHWAVMLRPHQCTLGSLILACKQPVTAFGEINAHGYAELQRAVRSIETMLSAAIGYQKINYLMLMMVDPDVHFHVFPRYEGEKSHGALTVADTGWPGPPRLDAAVEPDRAQTAALISHLREHWPG